LVDGGGYGTGAGVDDFSNLVYVNGDGFIHVAIQYRLGAFGFLSSDEVARFGTPNAGLLDQNFSFQWVQKYIHLFGGDPSRVTIAGESAGGGSVMNQVMAYGGKQTDKLFNNAIVASPYLPMQWGYNELEPSQAYYQFAAQAGCLDSTNVTIFSCLVGKDTATLQQANTNVTGHGKYGQWAFLPVVDGKFIQKRPTEQLLAHEVNGVRMLSGVSTSHSQEVSNAYPQ
jgi:carboxylesterase type B